MFTQSTTDILPHNEQRLTPFPLKKKNISLIPAN